MRTLDLHSKHPSGFASGASNEVHWSNSSQNLADLLLFSTYHPFGRLMGPPKTLFSFCSQKMHTDKEMGK